MTDTHKAALAVGRSESKAVRDYLEALKANRPKRGRKRTAESIARRLEAIEAELLEADPLGELKLIQERMDLQNEIASMDTGIDITALEAEFVRVGASYSERQGISYAAWRKVGVDAAVLTQAGIGRAAS